MSELLDQIVKLPAEERDKLIRDLSDDEVYSLLYDWKFWARPEQLPPDGDWNTWVYLAGRGAGKTRAGAEWVTSKARENPKARIALIAPTVADTRDVIVEGESGLLSISSPDFKPLYEPSKRSLRWPNGALAKTYSAEEPERLRGPQHTHAWCDELAAWRYLDETWNMMRFGLRVPPKPQVIVTTTPKPTQRLIRLYKQYKEGDKNIVFTIGNTYSNRANLAENYFNEIIQEYEGTRLGRQEIHGEILTDIQGALWTIEQIDQLRIWINEPIENWAQNNLNRIVVAVDPAVTSGENSDETGIIVAGKGHDGHFYTLADLSGTYTPNEWASRVAYAYHLFNADAVVGEVNNGGDLIKANIRQQDQNIRFIAVHASRGKYIRAEPIAALTEQGIDHHVCVKQFATGRYGDYMIPQHFQPNKFDKLEDQMIAMVSGEYVGEGSPDRVDAKVWALTELSGKRDFKRLSVHRAV